MARDTQGFSIDVESRAHLLRICLWGHWNTKTAEWYLRELQQKLSASPDGRNETWAFLLDLTSYVLPSQEVQAYIEQGFIQLRTLSIVRQAVLLHGPIIHLPGQAAPQAETFIVSYFQSEDEALEWLLEE